MLIRPSSDYVSQISEYRQDFLISGGSMDGTGPLRRTEDPLEYLRYCQECEDPG